MVHRVTSTRVFESPRKVRVPTYPETYYKYIYIGAHKIMFF